MYYHESNFNKLHFVEVVLRLLFQFGASFLTRASLTRTSLARPTSARCQFGARQFGARQFGAYSSFTRGSLARFASLARCSFFTFSLHAHTFGTAQGDE